MQADTARWGSLRHFALSFQLHRRYTVYIIDPTVFPCLSARLGVFRGGVQSYDSESKYQHSYSRTLILFAQNVRHSPREDIDALAHSILQQGVLQSLVVTKSAAKGKAAFEVVAGGRRLRRPAETSRAGED